MSISDLYREEIIDHAKNPRNFGKLSKPDIKQKENNPLCGDQIELQLKFDEKNKVQEAAFQGEGCFISKASASIITEKIKGKTIEELKKISANEILDVLGVSLASARLKCATLVLVALKKGLEKYSKK